jgi:ribulose 1,5-bisphosphate carboxylase large subunit-like protein
VRQSVAACGPSVLIVLGGGIAGAPDIAREAAARGNRVAIVSNVREDIDRAVAESDRIVRLNAPLSLALWRGALAGLPFQPGDNG